MTKFSLMHLTTLFIILEVNRVQGKSIKVFFDKSTQKEYFSEFFKPENNMEVFTSFSNEKEEKEDTRRGIIDSNNWWELV
mmetsp:Transcript_17371/g.19348  ORF Transcript_17371/g.19348 Transcript_17371/m.19348 type:complete len:80 (+) Transcript_17371:85-324(+)